MVATISNVRMIIGIHTHTSIAHVGKEHWSIGTGLRPGKVINTGLTDTIFRIIPVRLMQKPYLKG